MASLWTGSRALSGEGRAACLLGSSPPPPRRVLVDESALATSASRTGLQISIWLYL
jgi:hypothetical protein